MYCFHDHPVEEQLGEMSRTVREISVPNAMGDVNLRYISLEEGRSRKSMYYQVWAHSWTITHPLLHLLAQIRHQLVGKRILELGSGTGKLGTFLGLLGAEVTLTDYAPPALHIARECCDWSGDQLVAIFIASVFFRVPSILCSLLPLIETVRCSLC